MLGIDPLATDEQIREAWLRQVRAHHPDRLIAQGLPEEAIAVANRKLALINDAYDRLRRERGLRAAALIVNDRRPAVAQLSATAGRRDHRHAGAALHRAAAAGVARHPERRHARASRQRALCAGGRRHGSIVWCPRSASPGMPAVRHWRGREALNATSIGIEIVNLHGDRHDYPRAADRGADRALPRHPRAPSGDRAAQRRRPFRHRPAAQDRSRPALSLEDAGGRRHRTVAAGRRGGRSTATSTPALQRYGYAPPIAVPPREIVKAFQRHFRPAKVDGMADPETRALLAGLLDPLGGAPSQALGSDGWMAALARATAG